MKIEDGSPPVTALRSYIMSRIRSTDTAPERALCAGLRLFGAPRFRRNVRALPGSPDVVFPKHRLAVFVDGDFWHGRRWEDRLAAGQFKVRRDFWISKIERNMARDRSNNRALWALGWRVRRIWATDLLKRPDDAAERVLRALAKCEGDSAIGGRRHLSVARPANKDYVASMRSLFPTFVYRKRAVARGGPALNRALLREALITREIDDDGRRWSKANYFGGYTSYSSINDLHRRFSTFTDLMGRLDPHVRAFARALEWDLQGGRLSMTSCWINVMPEATAHGMHLHPLSAVSGTYYVRLPKGAGGLKFEDPRLSRLMAAPPRKDGCSLRNRTHVEERARVGDVVLFESWLRHEVPAARYRGERVSVSFNYDWV